MTVPDDGDGGGGDGDGARPPATVEARPREVPVTVVPLDQRLIEATTHALEMFGVYLGTRLGLYLALAHGSHTPAGLAAAAGIHPRYAREWLEQQAVAGFLAVEDVQTPAEDRCYSLPSEHRSVLVDPENPAHVAPFAEMVVGIAAAMDSVVVAYRTGSGVPFGAYGADMRRGQGAINRPAFRTDLASGWLAAMPDLHERLRRPGARIADLGCGVGWSSVALAAAFPAARVVGLDLDEPSIGEAHRNAAREGVRVEFLHADAAALAVHGPFDAVLIIEALHDMARPVEILAACRGALTVGGSVVVVDEHVSPEFIAPGDTLERMMYGWSITHCLPAAMAEQPSAALGTVLRPAMLEQLARQAGFAEVDLVNVDAGFFNVYRLRDTPDDLTAGRVHE